MSDTRHLRLFTYLSSKGGVGKSTLAVWSARHLARLGRRVAVLDLDMWGSSLADGLSLEAPEIPKGPDGALNLGAPATGRWRTRDETVWARHERQRLGPAADAPAEVTYFNDALFAPLGAGRLRQPLGHFLWREAGGDGNPAFVPSSPLLADLERVAAWLAAPELERAWAARVWAFVLSLAEGDPAVTDVVCDLPPGLVGLGHVLLSLVGTLGRREPLPDGFPAVPDDLTVEVLPSLVTTPDRNSLAVSVEAFVRHRAEVPSLALVVNRTDEAANAINRRIASHFIPYYGLDPFGVGQHLRFVPEERLWRAMFRGIEDGRLADDTSSKLARTLRLEVS